MFDPETFEQLKGEAAVSANKFLARFTGEAEWTSGDLVLDYGSGPGSAGFNHILPMVEKYGGKLYSCDVSERMVEFARKRYPSPLITYEVGNIMEDGGYPFEGVKFDKVVCNMVFHFIKDYRAGLAKVFDLVKPGGVLALTALSQPDFFWTLAEIGGMEKWKDLMKDYKKLYLPEWDEKRVDIAQVFGFALKDTGFQVQTLETVSGVTKTPSVEKLADLLIACNPFTKVMTDQQLLQIKQDLEEKIEESIRIGLDGRPEIDYKVLYVVARRPIKEAISSRGW